MALKAIPFITLSTVLLSGCTSTCGGKATDAPGAESHSPAPMSAPSVDHSKASAPQQPAAADSGTTAQPTTPPEGDTHSTDPASGAQPAPEVTH
jgi:hypothetical protein